jgi:hypothetical protein
MDEVRCWWYHNLTTSDSVARGAHRYEPNTICDHASHALRTLMHENEPLAIRNSAFSILNFTSAKGSVCNPRPTFYHSLSQPSS